MIILWYNKTGYLLGCMPYEDFNKYTNLSAWWNWTDNAQFD